MLERAPSLTHVHIFVYLDCGPVGSPNPGAGAGTGVTSHVYMEREIDTQKLMEVLSAGKES